MSAGGMSWARSTTPRGRVAGLMNGKRREYASACVKSNSLMPGVWSSICTSSDSGADTNTSASISPPSRATTEGVGSRRS